MTRAKTPKHRVYFRRRREGRTNFAKRLALVKSGTLRMVVRKSNRHITVQFSEFGEKGDRTLMTTKSLELRENFSFPAKRNTSTAYLTGLLAAHVAKKKGIKEFVLDIGLHAPTKGSVVFAALKGAIDGGLKTTGYEESMIPMDKISNPKEGIKPLFEQAKKKILAS
jgi:large subunit ribosomal protein L18